MSIIDKVKQLISIMNENELSEIEIILLLMRSYISTLGRRMTVLWIADNIKHNEF